MIQSIVSLRAQAQKVGLTFWPIHKCSGCGYQCGYVIKDNQVSYDMGCDCIEGENQVRERSWFDLARSYNDKQPENNPYATIGYLDHINQYWKF